MILTIGRYGALSLMAWLSQGASDALLGLHAMMARGGEDHSSREVQPASTRGYFKAIF